MRSGRGTGRRAPLATVVLLAAVAAASFLHAQEGSAQWTPLDRGSDNIEVLGHLPLGGHNNLADMDMEQELSRPYAYVARARYDGVGPVGTVVVDISDPEAPTKITEWRIENQDLHVGGARDVKYFKWADRYYVVQSLQFRQGGPNPDLGAVEYAPLRIFDLQPGLDGEVSNIRRPTGAWTADWKHLSHNHEVRWPFVFVSGYLDGLQVFEMMDPEHPKTVAFYDTNLESMVSNRQSALRGAFGVDVRNADGLIAVSDMTTGFWTFRMEGFQGWNGEGWGMPDISSAQEWDEDPSAPAVGRSESR